MRGRCRRSYFETRLGYVEITIWPYCPPATAHIAFDAFELLLPADAESDALAALPLPRVEALKVSRRQRWPWTATAGRTAGSARRRDQGRGTQHL